MSGRQAPKRKRPGFKGGGPRHTNKRCDSGKLKWRTRLDALMAAGNLVAGTRVYRCPDCGGWHVARPKALKRAHEPLDARSEGDGPTTGESA